MNRCNRATEKPTSKAVENLQEIFYEKPWPSVGL